MKKIVMLGVAVCISFFTIACQKEGVSSEKVNDILKQESYMKVEWGLPKYREKNTIGVSFGEEGTEIYEADGEMYPELYAESYLSSVTRLNLSTKEVKDSNYHIKVADKTQLKWFEQELYAISTMVIEDSYDLSGVSIEFDEKYRPVKKIFRLKKKENTMLGNDENESINCIQKFSYDVGKMKFNRQFRQVEKMTEKE